MAVVVLRMVQAGTPQAAAPTVEEIRQERGVPVSVAEATRGELDLWLPFNGTVAGVRDAVIRARTSDQIAAVPVSVGDPVGAGEVVVRQAGEATEARRRQARLAVEQAERTVNRLRPLFEAGAISEQEFDQAVTQLELARADLAAASEALVLTSPLSGTVTEVAARPGMIPSPGEPLVRVADLSRLVVRMSVSAREAALIDEGQPARLADGSARGKVRRVALQADPESRLVEVEAVFPPGSALVPGTLATAEIRVASAEQAVQVPGEAVSEGMVWVVDQAGRAIRREVEVGLVGARRVEILSGLEPGDRVVVEGGTLLSDGAQVRIVGGAGAVDDDV